MTGYWLKAKGERQIPSFPLLYLLILVMKAEGVLGFFLLIGKRREALGERLIVPSWFSSPGRLARL